MTKVCCNCKEDKESVAFYKNSSKADGLDELCQMCKKEWAKQYRLKNIQRATELSNLQYEKHKDSKLAYIKRWSQGNKEAVNAASARWDRSHKEHKAIYNREYRLNNPEQGCASTARRRAQKHLARPGWADIIKIKEFYAQAAELTKQTGTKHEVDHIVPLQSKIVCGLHCEQNLQIITKVENQRKRNIIWPNMP